MHVLVVTGGNVNLNFAGEYIKTLSYDKVFAVDKGLQYVSALGLTPDRIIGDFDSLDAGILEEYEKRKVNVLQTVIERHPSKKAATDTELALLRAREEGADQITILGATGSRMDHLLANINLLMPMEASGVHCAIVDEANRIRLVGDTCTVDNLAGCGVKNNMDSNAGKMTNCEENALTGEQNEEMTFCKNGDEYGRKGLTRQGGGMHDVTLEKDAQFGTYISLIPISSVLHDVTMEGVMYPVHHIEVLRENSLTVSNQITEKAAHIHIGEGTALLIESRD